MYLEKHFFFIKTIFFKISKKKMLPQLAENLANGVDISFFKVFNIDQNIIKVYNNKYI